MIVKLNNGLVVKDVIHVAFMLSYIVTLEKDGSTKMFEFHQVEEIEN